MKTNKKNKKKLNNFCPNAENDPNSPQNSKYIKKQSNACWNCYSEECSSGCMKD